jgi:uncharacterized protein
VKRFRFLPTEENFFELFDDLAQTLVEASECLYDLTVNYVDVEEKTKALRLMEKRTDEVTDGVCRRIGNSFVTPFDREDILNLISSMDDVLDYIEASADRMKLYSIDKPREEAIELAALIVEGVKQIKIAVSALSNLRRIEHILEPCVKINEIENRADQVLRRALGRLFKEEPKPLEIAKWFEIFDRLEIATDRCEDVADVLESIVVKNA